MNQIWNTKGIKVDEQVLRYTSQSDAHLDETIFFPYDLDGTLAHAEMLHAMALLTDDEFFQAKKGLGELKEQFRSGSFKIKEGMEDGHTAIEAYLTEKYGDVGKKIHTARSRNDQVLTMLRLYSKEQFLLIIEQVNALINVWRAWAKEHEGIPMPGYTHMQRAMPTTVTMWQGAYADLMEDTKSLLISVSEICDQSPLGSGAGFGIPLKIDRKKTAQLLGFKKVQENPIYCQLSRGPFESMMVFALQQAVSAISKWANDLLLFTMSEFKFFSLEREFCTSSSIMPQKVNYDVLELLRASSATLEGACSEILKIHGLLHTGYNRDLQLIKAPLVRAFETSSASIEMAIAVAKSLKANSSLLNESMTEDLFATEKVYKLVEGGMSFRDAYAKVKESLEES